MASRLVLLGAAEGPWCGISEVRKPVLLVSGLKKGTVKVVVRGELDATYDFEFSTDGTYELSTGPKLSWIKASASDPTKSLICTVIPAKAA